MRVHIRASAEERSGRKSRDELVDIKTRPMFAELRNRTPSEVEAWVEENVALADTQAKDLLKLLAMAVVVLLRK